ncbi:MAG: hypothetical protein PHP50_11010 [Lachnospiraceae bacterium]|nr:hypothetical protein [Lachnospiraceae bacterium]
MLTLQYIGLKSKYEVEFENVSKHIIQVIGNVPEKTKGFILSRQGHNDKWDYSKFTTVYRSETGYIQFSDDGTIYVAPVQPEVIEPTAEELEEQERQKNITDLTNQIQSKKEKLASSDYIIIKLYEMNITGTTNTEYDIDQLHAERQALRDEINALTEQLNLMIE